MTTDLTVADVRQLLLTAQGVQSLRNFAHILGVSHSYLHDVLQQRRIPGPKILDALGLELVITHPKQVAYRRREK